MTEVTLRYKWIPQRCAWFLVFEPVLPQEAIFKNLSISPGSGSQVSDKNTESVVYYKKKGIVPL
jgi:hypothetical protein